MALTRFINVESVLASNTKILGRVIPDSILKVLSYKEGLIDNFKIQDSSIDLHLYNNANEYIKSLYNQNVIFDSEYNDFYFDVSKFFFNSNISTGGFKICFNFSLDLFGNAGFKPLHLKEVSPDSMELKFEIPREIIIANSGIINQFKEFDLVSSNLRSFGRLNNLVINFGKNIILPIVNLKVECAEDNFLYVKLLNELDIAIDVNDACHVAFKLCEDYIDSFLVSPFEVQIKPNMMRGPNFDVPFELEGGDATAFENWDSLLDSTETTTNDLLQTIISSSKSIPLNIDYTDYSNFVHYGSATERMKNYDYKRRLIEYYNTQLISSSVSSSYYGGINNTTYKNKINNIQEGFDPYERWMHFESGSLFTHDITGSNTPAPKYINGSKYELYATSESIYQNWYSSSLEYAELYDRNNLNRLYEYTPGHIVNDSNNSEYILFLEMIGHHFDNIYAYVQELTSIHSKDEHPKRGIPSKLLREYAESLGWHITNGYQLSDLWLYKLGTDNSGSYNDLVTLPSLAREELSNQIWRRVVNNLPILLKTKGTSRSVRSLINTYGIPKTLISFKEYGGPDATGFNSYREENVFNYALRLGGDRYVDMPMYPLNGTGSATFEFRFKTDYSASLSMSLWSVEDKANRDIILHNLELVSYLSETTSSYSGSYSYGKLRYTGTYQSASVYISSSSESEYLPLFDGDFWNLQIRTNDYISNSNPSSSITISVAKSSDYTYNRISFSSSFDWVPADTIAYTFGADPALEDNSHHIVLGGSTGSAGLTRFSGSVQFYKEYSNILNLDQLIEHSLNPASYTSIDYSSSYKDLRRYFPLGGDVIRYNHTSSIVVVSSQPDRSKSGLHRIATFVNFTGTQADQYSANNEVFYTKAPVTGAVVEKSNKIRLESSSTNGIALSPNKRVENSAYDRSSKDNNRLVIAFSPTDQINRDIYNQLGYFDLNNVLGDPRDLQEDYYSSIARFRNEYWKKYSQINNLNKYIEVFSLFNFAFFEQVKQLVPARANLISGILIENTALERNRSRRREPSIFYNKIDGKFAAKNDDQTGKYIYYTASLEPPKEIDITHILEEGLLDIERLVFIGQHDYTGSAVSALRFASVSGSTSSSNSQYVRGTNDYVGQHNSVDNFIIADSKYPNDQKIELSVDLNVHEITSTIPTHTKSGSLGGNLISNNLYNSTGSYDVIEADINLKVYDSVLTASFIDPKDYLFNVPLYEDKTFNRSSLENRIGYIDNFKYEEYYSGNFTGSTGLTSSLMSIQTTFSGSDLYTFIDKYGYVIDSDGYFYSMKNNGSKQVYITGSLTNKFYKKRKFFYSGSNDNYKYNHVNIAISMSKGLYYSSSFEEVNYQYDEGSVYNRIRYEGSRLEGPGFNINTTNTIDGGPVVTIVTVNSNDLRV